MVDYRNLVAYEEQKPHHGAHSGNTMGSVLFCAKWEEVFYYICLAFVLLGGVNWGLVGFADWNLVEAITAKNKIAQRVIYALVGTLTLAVLIMTIVFAARPNCASDKTREE